MVREASACSLSHWATICHICITFYYLQLQIVSLCVNMLILVMTILGYFN